MKNAKTHFYLVHPAKRIELSMAAILCHVDGVKGILS